MSRIFWDTNIYIYLFAENPLYVAETKRLRERIVERGDTLVTSVMTLGEIQVRPRRDGDLDFALTLRRKVVESSHIVAMDESVADAFAEVRARTRVRGADAVQLAAASVDIFVTNDKRLHQLPKLPGIAAILPLEKVAL